MVKSGVFLTAGKQQLEIQNLQQFLTLPVHVSVLRARCWEGTNCHSFKIFVAKESIQ